jgi:hypothetical protein
VSSQEYRFFSTTSDARHSHHADVSIRTQPFYVYCHPDVTKDAGMTQLIANCRRAGDNVFAVIHAALRLTGHGSGQ